jgi:hypothetical protein
VKPAARHNTPSAQRPQRLILFKVLAIGMPLVLLALLEGMLRLFGYGHDYRLFVADEKYPEYRVMNRYASARYFTETENATIGNYERFTARKGGQTFRVFVLGESTTVGFPYLHNGSFHRWLQYRLMHTFPETHFEIINLSLTAVNSYTVLGFAREIVDYAPDAVLIYTGHNEYYGALGVGSTSSLGSNPYLVRLVLKAREYRLVQLANAAVTGLRRLFSPPVDQRETLMKRMAAKQQIPLDSEVYTRGIRQFETNLAETLRLLSEKNIPVFVSNLVSNEKDLKPFISDTGRNELSAAYHFAQAGQAYARGEYSQAKQLYVRAKDLDLLRFRAPEAINEIIQRLSKQFANVHLVDAKSLLEAHSPRGILGNELLLEHVHPNLSGYALLSEAFYQGLKAQRLITDRWPPEMSLDDLRRQMPITPVDSLKGAYEIMMLREGWPFNEPMTAPATGAKSLEEQLAGALAVKQISWGEAMTRLLNHYLRENRPAEALRVTEALLLEYPYDPAYYVQAGKLAMNLEDNERAAFYLKKAFSQQPAPDLAQSIFITLLKMDRPEEALPYVQYAAGQSVTNQALQQLPVYVQQIIALKAQYTRDPENVQLANQIAAAYLAFANTRAASKYVERSLVLAHNNAEALKLRAQIAEMAD